MVETNGADPTIAQSVSQGSNKAHSAETELAGAFGVEQAMFCIYADYVDRSTSYLLVNHTTRV